MAGSGWVTLSTRWEIGNVRAVLSFIINLLSAFGLWVVAYVSWKSAASRAIKSSSTEIMSLFSMTGLGDVWECMFVLRPTMGVWLMTKLILQGSAVVLLSVASILAGPIARYSTRPGTEVVDTTVQGWLATSNHNAMIGALVPWNSTIERLDAAQFPLDQLLDYLPSNEVDWVYREKEWNSSWSMACEFTGSTPIRNLETTGNYTNFWTEVPQIRDVFPQKYVNRSDYDAFVKSTSNYEDPYYYKDFLAFVVVQNDPGVYATHDGNNTNDAPLDIVMASFLLHNVTQPRNSSCSSCGIPCSFGIGPVGYASYTMASCHIERRPEHDYVPQPGVPYDAVEDPNIAFPWTQDPRYMVQGMSSFFSAAMTMQSFTSQPVYHPTGTDMARFYQAYIIAKDTQYQHSVSRTLSVITPSVELSIPALVVLSAIFGSLLTLTLWLSWREWLSRLGDALQRIDGNRPTPSFIGRLAAVVAYPLPQRRYGPWIPRTKLEWIMEGVREVGGREVDSALLFEHAHQMPPVRSSYIYSYGGQQAGRVKVGAVGGTLRSWSWRLRGEHMSPTARLRAELRNAVYGRVVAPASAATSGDSDETKAEGKSPDLPGRRRAGRTNTYMTVRFRDQYGGLMAPTRAWESPPPPPVFAVASGGATGQVVRSVEDEETEVGSDERVDKRGKKGRDDEQNWDWSDDAPKHPKSMVKQRTVEFVDPKRPR